MKYYVITILGSQAIVEIDQNSAEYEAYMALPNSRRPVFLSAQDEKVVEITKLLENSQKNAANQTNLKNSALAKIAKVAEKAGLPLTDEELAALL